MVNLLTKTKKRHSFHNPIMYWIILVVGIGAIWAGLNSLPSFEKKDIAGEAYGIFPSVCTPVTNSVADSGNDDDKFYVTNNAGCPVAWFSSSGDLATKSTVRQLSLTPSSSEKQFVIMKDDVELMSVDNSGVMSVKGNVLRDVDSISTADIVPEFIVRDASGNANILLDSNGNLHIKGNSYTYVAPAEEPETPAPAPNRGGGGSRIITTTTSTTHRPASSSSSSTTTTTLTIASTGGNVNPNQNQQVDSAQETESDPVPTKEDIVQKGSITKAILPIFIGILVAIFLAGSIVLGIFLFKSKSASSKLVSGNNTQINSPSDILDSKLRNYVAVCKSKGYTKERIRMLLKKSGYKDGVIDKYLR